MWPYLPDLLATPVPRYTSFPTAAEFGHDVGPAHYEMAIAGVAGDISLYIHIPFCERICWYCGCNTGAANRKQRLTSYLEALHREIELVAALLPQGAKIRRIAYGGGSPNAISPDDFLRLHHALGRQFTFDAPTVSVELDPRSLDRSWVGVLSDIGVSNASLGVQTFAVHCQEAIGRIQPLCMIEHGVRILREAGVGSINFDLMYGLPGQTWQDLHDTLSLASDFAASRIALFGYAHVPHLIPRQRKIDARALPGSAERFAQAAGGHEFLLGCGYLPVGFDHFALPGDPLAQAAVLGRVRRNFQGFTDDPSDVLIGLGASAISSFRGLLSQNEKNSGRYRMMLSQDRLPVSAGKARSAEDQRRGAAIESLLCRHQASVDPAMLQSAMPRLTPYLDAGLCHIDGTTLIIAANALPHARSIAAAFDPYRQDSARRFSSAV